MSERPFSQATGAPIVVAHRGASAADAENTLAAFETAIAAGAEAVEFDVRLTADGVPVVIHDAELDRTTDAAGPVVDRSLEELRGVRIRARDGWASIPTFAEVLDAVAGRVAVDVEVKNVPGERGFEPGGDRVVAATLETLAAAGYDGDVLVSSFDPIALDAVRRRAPDVATGLLTAPDVDALASVAFARDRGHRWVLPFVGAARRAGPALPEAAHAAGLRVGTWLTDRPAEAVALFRAGIDAVATNDPGPIVTAVREAFGG